MTNSPILVWHDLVHRTDQELSRTDLAEINLACAADLPGAARIDHDLCIRALNFWARGVARYTAQALPHFHQHPGEFDHSEDYFRALCLITFLQRDCGVRYHPDKRSDDAPLTPEDVHIHGVIQGEGGTCASLPVVYAAVGRRLNYPMKLVTTGSHLFVRWEGESHTFNMEATAPGLSCPPDDYFRQGKYGRSKEEELDSRLLVSMSPKEELANFLSQRAYCFMDLGQHRATTEAFMWAINLAPDVLCYGRLACASLDRWRNAIRERLPKRYPDLEIREMPRQFHNLDPEMEKQFVTLSVAESLLDDPELANGWEALRRDPSRFPPGMPAKICVQST